MKTRSKLWVLALMASASMAMAAFTPISSVSVNTVDNGAGVTNHWLQSVTVGIDIYGSNTLFGGTMTDLNGNDWSGPVSDYDLHTIQGNIGNTPSAGAGLPVKSVLFDGHNWTDSNGSLLDFFLFEVGASTGDSYSIAAIFADDTLGQTVPGLQSGGWGNTGLRTGEQAPGSQFILGTAWSITDLLDAGGNPLTTSDTIKGIAFITGGGLDVAGFYAVVVPEPSAMALALLGLGGLALIRRRS